MDAQNVRTVTIRPQCLSVHTLPSNDTGKPHRDILRQWLWNASKPVERAQRLPEWNLYSNSTAGKFQQLQNSLSMLGGILKTCCALGSRLFTKAVHRDNWASDGPETRHHSKCILLVPKKYMTTNSTKSGRLAGFYQSKT